MQKKKQPQTIFLDIKGDSQPTVIQSVCMSCYQNGQTRILLTKIPFFRQIMVTSFSCDKCGYKNNQVQFAGKLPDYGIQILFKALTKQDLNRQIIISQHAILWIEQLDLQLPKIKKAQITTLQGLLKNIQDDLSIDQQQRKQKQQQQFIKIQLFIQRIKQYYSGSKFPITLRIKDPSGNSNIKNPYAPKIDKNLSFTSIPRTLQDLIKMGYSPQNAQQQIDMLFKKRIGNKMNFTKPFQQNQFMKYQPVLFDVPCHSCQMPGQMKMCQTSIPYFTDMIIMSFVCDYCGAHSTQTKNTGDVKQQGCKIILKCKTQQDLKRDLFKSQTCSIQIPQLELQLDYGTLGGVFTTVQGLLQKISDHLGQQNPFTDSDNNFRLRMDKLLKQLQQIRKGQKLFTLIMKDPLGHSFLENPYHPNQDKNVQRISYKRTKQQNDIFGLSDMKVQNYGQTNTINNNINNNNDTKSTGSMKKSKDRRYSQGSCQSLQQLKKKKKEQQGLLMQSPHKKQSLNNNQNNINQEIKPDIKFTKQSPHKISQEQAHPQKILTKIDPPKSNKSDKKL